jgi:hypothetical protein
MIDTENLHEILKNYQEFKKKRERIHKGVAYRTNTKKLLHFYTFTINNLKIILKK